MEENKENEDQRGARTVIVPRTDNEFGFTLRHFIVYPPKSTVKDEAVGDGDGQKAKRSKLSTFDPMDTIFVKQVKEEGPAQHAGLHTGDRILSVNGESVAGKTYSQVIALIQSSDKSLKLLVVPKDEDVLQMTYEASAYKQNRDPYRGHALDIPEPPTDVMFQEANPKQERTIKVKPPPSNRFKTELQINPKNAPQRTGSDPMLHPVYPRAGGGSLQSVSSGSSSGVRNVDSRRQEDELHYGDEVDNTSSQDSYRYTPQGSSDSPSRGLPWVTGPPRPRVVADRRAGSIDSISRSSDHSSQSRGSHRSAGSLRSQDSSGRSQDSSGSASSYSPKPKDGTRDTYYFSKERHSEPHLLGDYPPGQRHSLEGYRGAGEMPARPRSHGMHPVPAPYPSHHGSIEQGIPTYPGSTSATVHSSYQPMGSPGLSSGAKFNTLCSRAFTSLAYVPPVMSQSVSAAPQQSRVVPLSCSANLLRSQSGEIAPAPPSFAQQASPFRRFSGQEPGWAHNRQKNISLNIPPGTDVEINISGSQAGTDLPGTGAQITVKRSMPQPQINLVSSRAKIFEQPSKRNDIQERYRAELSKVGGYQRGGESVSARAAQFEPKVSESDDESHNKKVRVEITHPQPVAPPQGLHAGYPGVNSTEDTLYETAPPKTPTLRLEPSPVHDLFGDSGSDRSSIRDRSPLSSDNSPPTSRGQQGVSRQPSYLRAINSPRSRFLDTPDQHPAATTLSTMTATTTTTTTCTSVVLRHPGQAIDDSDARLQRRRSYLMATGTDRPAPAKSPTGGLHQSLPEPLQLPQQSSHEILMHRPMVIDVPLIDQSPYNNTNGPNYQSPLTTGPPKYKEPPTYASPPRIETLAFRSTNHGPSLPGPPNGGPPGFGFPSIEMTISKNAQGSFVVEPSNVGPPLSIGHYDNGGSAGMEPQDHFQEDQNNFMTPPSRGVSIKKLKAFFGERTPRIMEVTRDPKQVFDLPSPIGMGDPLMEGMLNFKVAVTDGKRASDRSWKPMWAVLRGHALYLYKEKGSAASNPNFADEQPISIKNSVVDIAYKYTKKKNVFQLMTYNGSEYLFQAEEQATMVSWIDTIRKNSNPDSDDKGVASEELILRKTSEAGHTFKLASPPAKAIKTLPSVKKVSVKSLKMKTPTAHSPGPKPRKASERDILEIAKGKDRADRADNKTWRGRVYKKFKRYGSSSSTQPEVSGTFGVPIELCPASSFSEFVPLAVELCTTIVEARGMEMTGIYRVPGNTGAINMLQEELNKGGENIEFDSDKWLDVNVVGSLLKSYFRKLPEPLVTEELYDLFITANREDNPEKRMLKIKKLLHELPEHHFETFLYLAKHLNKVASMEHLNKMDCRNLAIVFGPTLVRTVDDSMVTMVKDMSDQCRIVESVILHPDWFFSSWDVDSYVPIDEEPADGAPISRMNQALISKAEYLANRKKKRKDKLKSADIPSVEADIPSDVGYNERNIDLEVSLRKGKESSTTDCPPIAEVKAEKVKQEHAQQEPAQRSATTRDGIYSARMVFLMNNNQESRGDSVPPSEKENSNVEIKRYPAIPVQEPSTTCSTENTKPMPIYHRRYSEDLVNDNKVSPSSRGGSPWSQGGLQRSRTEVDGSTYEQNECVQSNSPRSDSRRQVQYAGWTPEAVNSQDTGSEDVLMRSTDSTTSATGRSPDFTLKTDTMSTTSDYSTMSSRNSSQDTRHSLQVVPTTTTSLSSVQVTGANLRHSRNVLPKSQSAEWRKCTIAEGGKYFVMSSAGDGPRKYIAKDDSELYKGQKFDTQRVAGRGTLRRKDRTGEESREAKEAKELFRRSVSLDSLLDHAQEQALISPLPTSVSKSSEDEDLVSSMTATFDEKLKFLMDSSSTSSNVLPEQCASLPMELAATPSQVKADVVHNGANDKERRYRSPSLHKEHPLVRVAARFDRRMSDSSVLDVKSDSVEYLKEKENYAAALRKSTEKMFGSRELLLGKDKLPESHTFKYMKRKSGLALMQNKAASASPPVKRREPKEMKGRRRHTVGGTTDLRNFKALITVNQQSKSIERRSAWERLQPAVKSDTRDVQTWLQERRLHTAGSSPAILAPSLRCCSPVTGVDTRRDATDTSAASRDVSRTHHAHSEPTSPGAIPTSRLQRLDIGHKFSF